MWADAQGRAIQETTLDGSSLIRDAATRDVLYTAPAGTVVWSVSDDLSRAVLVPIAPESTGPAQIVEVKSGRVICDIASVYLPYFSDDGSLLLSSSNSPGTFSVYRTGGCQLLAELPFMSIRPMPDGKSVSVVDKDGTIWLGDLQKLVDGVPVERASSWHAFATDGLVLPVGHVANTDGSLIAVTGGAGDTVKIWQTDDGTEVAVLDSKPGTSPPYIFFHPDAPHVTLLGDSGRRLMTYTLDVEELLEIAEDRVARSLTDAECQTFLHVDTCPAVGTG